jgi:hypothetical protein
MNADEIVKALMCDIAEPAGKGYAYTDAWIDTVKEHCKLSVDMIESLQAQCKTEFDIATGYHRKWQKAESQLAESRRREKEAVIDLIAVAHKYGDCEFCKWADERGRCTEPNPGNLCAEHYKMVWRGTQEAGENKNESEVCH